MPTPRAVPDKYVGFFRLVEACDRPGCPVCRCLMADARQYLDSLIYERVTDPETRRRLHASWGFCNWHAWMLREVSDPAFGTAILYEDFLRAAIERFQRATDRPAELRPTWWRRLLPTRRAQPSRLAQLFRRRAGCPACSVVARSETSYLGHALGFVDDDQFDSSYSRSQGLCVFHLLRAVELGGETIEARQLVARTLTKWRELRRDLQGFIAKHDYRLRQPFTEAESIAYLRALETLAGTPGMFGNQPGARAAKLEALADGLAAADAHPASSELGSRDVE